MTLHQLLMALFPPTALVVEIIGEQLAPAVALEIAALFMGTKMISSLIENVC